LRLACVWPVLIGLQTLVLLAGNDDWLDPAKVSKVRRNDVYRMVAYSTCLVMSDSALRAWTGRLIAKIEGKIAR
jgi:farnesyl-diphosphate farnesyltransferase